MEIAANAVCAKQLTGGVEAAARQRDALRVVFSATYHARFIPNREAHRLCPEKFGIWKCSEADQAVQQRLGNGALSK